MTAGDDWRELNRANWDERVPIHRAQAGKDGPIYAGKHGLGPIEARELGPVAGLRVLHLQCHFGRDSLALAELGAEVTGLDFSAPAIEAARSDSAELRIPATFVHADVYDATEAVGAPGSFDLVYTTWGTITWLPDVAAWGRVIAAALRQGGRLYFADAHPTAMVFDEFTPSADGRPGWFAPYFLNGPLAIDDPTDYADPDARLVNARTVQFMHPVASVVGALLGAGLRLDFLHEHPGLTWQQFSFLVRDADDLWTWPDRPWFPLSYSIGATKAG